MPERYRDLNTYLREKFGCRVQKITVDAGLTCPNRDGTVSTGGCLYCNPRGSGSGAHARGMTITDQLHHGIPILARRYKASKFMAYFQSYSNTYAPVETLRRLYDEALAFEEIVGLSIGTRPDCITPGVLDLLQSYTGKHMVWVEYGLQSANNTTLTRLNRGHDVACFTRAVQATRGRGVNICAHVILGLPGESRADMLATADYLADLGIDGVKLHLLYVVKGTGLEHLYNEGQYQCLEQEEYAGLVCDVLERLPADTVIQRLHSDPHPDELVAPQWALDKNEIRKIILHLLTERDTWQGKLVDGIAQD
jgi:radical SAM protein (TIGR01212 family)